MGAFHSTENSGNFGWYIKWNGPFRFDPTGIFGTSLKGGPLLPVGPVEPKCPFPFDKFVPSTALLYLAFKDKMAECSDSMYECSICGNRSTDLQVLLMHRCSSITDAGTDSLPNSFEESLVMSVISPAPSSDTRNKRRILEKWEDKHVRLLIESYLKYKDLFGKPQLSKKKVFDKIAEEFNRTSDVVVTGDQCFRKFKKLEAKQKEIEDNNSKTGREKKTWKFHKEMEDCMGDNPTVKPVFTFDTSRGSSPSSSTRSSTSNLDEGLNSDSDSQETEAGCSSSKRPKRKRKQKSSASEMLDFLKDYTAKREKVEDEKLNILKAMQGEKKSSLVSFFLFSKIPKRSEYLLRNSIGRNILGLCAFQY